MEDYKVLAKIIQDYPDALSERKKLQALFSDFFPQDRLKRNTLLLKRKQLKIALKTKKLYMKRALTRTKTALTRFTTEILLFQN